MRSSPLAPLVVLVAALPCPILLRAQKLAGSVEGIVKDSSGVLVVGACVELVGSATWIRQSQQTEAGGTFLFPAVKPGAYSLSASLSGFKTARQRLDVELNKNFKVDFVIQVGEVTERVEVSAPPANVDVTHTEVAVNVESRLVVDLPSVNWDITTLVEMAPGARQVQGITPGGSQFIDLSGNCALGGATRRSQSVFCLDGSENMGAWRLQALQMPNPDTIQEVQIIASSASAEFGKEPGMSMHQLRTHHFHKREYAANAVCSQIRFLTNSALKEIRPAVESLKP